MKWFNFHHSFNDLVPDTKYFEEHPEYFSEIDGVRQKDSQLCLTNPDVLRIAEETLRRWIRENPECRVFSVAQNDNERRCTCEKCRELEENEGSPAGPIIHFVNRLADRIKDDYPHVLIHTFAYRYSLPAPRYVIARDNVIVRLCSISCRFDRPLSELASEGSPAEAEFVNALKDWRDHASRLYVWDYAVNFRNYCQPFVHLHVLKENVKLFRELGIKGVLEQGNFAYGGGAALDELKSYIISRLLWDPDTDVDLEISRFCKAVFGRVGDKMEKYVHLAMKICESAPLTIYQNPDAEYITDEFIKEADALFTDAISLAETEEIQKRVEREYLSVRFLKIARIPIGAAGRDELIDGFFEDVKSHGITEVRERRPHSVTKRIMKESPYMHEHSGYKLYYIMQ